MSERGRRGEAPGDGGIAALGRTPPGVGAGAAPASGAGLSRGSAEPSAELPCLLRAALGDRACSSGEDSWVEALLERMDLFTLSRASGPRIAAASSLGPRRARRLAAVFALGRHVEGARWEGAPDVSSPEAVHGLMAPRLRGLVVETFHVLLLDGKHRLRSVRRVSEGTLTTSLVHPREVFRPAIAEAAAAVVVAHNHPSGDPEPSREDLDVTRRLARVGRLIGIPLLDHVVVGHGVWVSIRDRITF